MNPFHPQFAAWVAAACLAASGGVFAATPAGGTDLAFAEMFVSPVGSGGLRATAKLLALEGQPVRMAGYMVRREAGTPGVFVLAPVPVSIGGEDDSFADDLPASAVYVHLPDAAEVPYIAGIVRLSGTLRTGPLRESDGRISSVRLIADAIPRQGTR